MGARGYAGARPGVLGVLMSTLPRHCAERPLVGVQIVTEAPLPVEGDGTVPRSRGAGFFCPRRAHAADRTGVPAWPC
ncbi:protein of unknown function [Micropruina glycogenica]|uniref:Uncharacterized protein n=1 Tax=Micropruina glycogenica TaxID=75385 RepID=A0A2N9JFT1_9ACTN|nr:protein of unknown function [Micropruina glycogenica]